MTENRVPAGVPTGGQFAASVKGEPQVRLTEAGTNTYEWSDDPTLAAAPKAAVALVAAAEARGMDVDVDHTPRDVTVNIKSGKNEVAVVWSKGAYFDTPHRGKLPFRTSQYGAVEGVRFDYATGFVRGEYVTPRSVRQARLFMGLNEK